MTVAESIKAIKDHARHHACDATYYVNPVIGQFVPQGDIAFVSLPKLPGGVKLVQPMRQLVIGSSKGSRHCIEGPIDDGSIEFYELRSPTELQGNVLRLKRQVEFSHPEHRNLVYPTGSILAVVFQRRYADEIRRAQD